jgi:hypothetical protein
MKTEKWRVLTNDGDTVRLRRETEEALEEAQLLRPDNIYPNVWRTEWPVGLEIGEDEFLDKTRFEELRRRVGLNKSEQWAVDRWNQPESAKKRQLDQLFTLARPVLAGSPKGLSRRTA